MPTAPLISFANLTCLYGDQGVLLDHFFEVLYPAFFNPSHVKRFGSTRYIFREVGIVNVPVETLQGDQITIYGRLIKKMVLRRDQTHSEESGLLKDEATLDSAPSAFFALDINNHKLVFLPETTYAPTLKNFAQTLQSFMRKEHANLLSVRYGEAKRAETPVTHRQLLLEIPVPDVDVTPMAGAGDINDFLETLARATKVEFQILNTNVEVNRGDTFRALQAQKTELNATRTALVHTNPDGLRPGALRQEVADAAEGGNQKVVITGVDADGGIVKGNNDDFKLRVTIPDLPDGGEGKAAAMIRSYGEQVARGRLRPDRGTDNRERVITIWERISAGFLRS